jgi:NAD(P)-dependent dehydrogenase (short-subunit alcohol dehydrogenase family)
VNISGSRVLLTGATGGLGRAIAKALHAKGAHVVVTGRKLEALQGLCDELGSNAEPLAADLALRDDLHAPPVGDGTIFEVPIQAAGQGDDAGIELPRWVPTKSPEDVAMAVVRSIEKNRPEIAVADPGQRLASVLENISARSGAWLRRRLPVEELADRTAEAQKVKR